MFACSFLFILIQFTTLGSSATSFKNAASGTGLHFGTKVQFKHNWSDSQSMTEKYPDYEKIILGEYDHATINSCYPRWDIGKNVKTLNVNKMKDQLTFKDCWYMANYTKDHNIDYRVHVLNWFKPDMHIEELDSSRYTVEEKKLFLREYTKIVMSELGADVQTFDVINEFIEDDAGGGKRDFISGVSTEDEMPDIACEIFLAAKEERQHILCGVNDKGEVNNCAQADDHNRMHLLYNDYDHMCAPPCNTGWYTSKDKAGRVFSFVQELAEKRCGIDSVGFQMHINRFFNDFEGLRRNIQRYADIGISVQLTEVDVRCGTTYSSNAECELDMDDPNAAWNNDMLNDQAYVYGEILKVCLEEPNCESFIMWDAADDVDTWDATLPPMNPYAFDKQFNPKPAYDTLLETLQNFPRDHPGVVARLSGSWRKIDVWEKVPTTFKDAAAGTGIHFGAKLQYKYMWYDSQTQFEAHPDYEKVILQEYDYATINSCYPRWDIGKNVKTLDIDRMNDELTFEDCWYMANYTKNHHIDYRIDLINWFKQDQHIAELDSIEYTLEEKKLYLREYTKKVMRELGADVQTFDVISQFIEDDAGGGKRNFISGVSTEHEMPDIACEVFLAAKEERQRILCGIEENGVLNNCAEASDHNRMHLLYNDYDHMCAPPCNNVYLNTKDKATRVFSFVQDLVEKRCGIDSVGFQMHINRFFNDFEGLRRNIRRYAEIGISVQLTEVDVRCGTTYSGGEECELNTDNPNAVWSDEMLEEQAYVYGEILKVCLEEPNCESFITWDAADGIDSWDATQPPMNPYAFDKQFQPKAAYYTLFETLRDFPRDHPGIVARLSGSWRKVDVWEQTLIEV